MEKTRFRKLKDYMFMRWWNSFNLLAVLLIAVALGGLISGGHMVFDPGRAPTGKEWLIYLVAGGLMLLNGLLPPATAPTPVKTGKATAKTEVKPQV